MQPLKYKGYINDEETGYYYLQSRYYSPFLKRFISLDDTGILEATKGEILGANLYAYCNNNPTMNEDPSGYYSYKWYDFYRARWFVSGLINLAISVIIGGSISKIASTLKKMAVRKGRWATQSFITGRLRGQLLKVGMKYALASKVVGVVGVIFTVLTAFLDIGGFIFDYVDKRDRRPRSGYWDAF